MTMKGDWFEMEIFNSLIGPVFIFLGLAGMITGFVMIFKARVG